MTKGKLYVVGVDQMLLPLAKYFAGEGSIPTIARLMERGAVFQTLASFPCYTANNWQVIASGANTGTHGAIGWFIRMPDGEDVYSLTSVGINAEHIWEAAERQGLKSAVVHYPGSSPSRLQKGYVVDGEATPLFGGCPFEIAYAEGYSTDESIKGAFVKPLRLAPAAGWSGLPTGGPAPLTAELPVTAKKDEDSRIWHLLVLGGEEGYDRVLVCTDKDVSSAIAETRAGAWSEWATVDFGERAGTVRFKAMAISPDAKTVSVYRSQIMPPGGFAEPVEIGAELVAKVGPYQEQATSTFSNTGVPDLATCLEEADYQAQWFAKAALYLTKEKDCDIFFCHWHYSDDVTHRDMGYVDPTWWRYDPEVAVQRWQELRETYQSIDRMMATLLEGVTDDDYVVMVSDHGCSPVNRFVFIECFLVDHGYLVFKDPNTPKTSYQNDWYEKIDWQKSTAWVREGIFNDAFSIHINADTPEQHKEVERRLLHDLRTWTDEKTGQTVLAMALSKRDAEMIGLWGDQVGDVVVVAETGYQFGKKASDTPLTDNDLGMSGGCARMMPTEETTYGTQKSMFIIAGPGVKRGYERPSREVGHMRLTDVTPTLCYALGIEPPAQSQGTIAYDAFEGHELARSRPQQTPPDPSNGQFKPWARRFFFEREVVSAPPSEKEAGGKN
ncbi:MAG: alkaline phosphatase family protein [Chloroflexota bacterium]